MIDPKKTYVLTHSVAGGTCLVDFIRGADSFTVLLNTAEARALPFPRYAEHGGRRG